MSVFILSFYGDLPTKRPDCRESLVFSTLEAAKRKVYEMFIQDDWGASPGSINLSLLPDPEDDRILIQEADPVSGKLIVRWAMNGWHWPQDESPDVNDELAINGQMRSLYQIAMMEEGVGFFGGDL